MFEVAHDLSFFGVQVCAPVMLIHFNEVVWIEKMVAHYKLLCGWNWYVEERRSNQ